MTGERQLSRQYFSAKRGKHKECRYLKKLYSHGEKQKTEGKDGKNGIFCVSLQFNSFDASFRANKRIINVRFPSIECNKIKYQPRHLQEDDNKKIGIYHFLAHRFAMSERQQTGICLHWQVERGKIESHQHALQSQRIGKDLVETR